MLRRSSGRPIAGLTRRLPAVLAVLALICAGPPARAQTAPLATVNIATVAVADNVPFRYAVREGWFVQAGLDIKISELAGGAAIAAAVIGGGADIGATNMFSAILARSKGIPIQIVAPGGRYDESNPTSQLLVAADSPIRTAKDLEGRTVAVAGLNDLAAISVRAWMTANGADPTKARFIEAPMATIPALFEARRIDAGFVSEPALQSAEAGGQTRMLAVTYTAIGKHFFTSVWIASPAFLAAHRDLALKFAEVMHRATLYTNAHYDEVIPLIAAYSKIPVETLRKMRQVRSGASLDAADVQPLIDAAVKYHEIPKAFPASEIMLAGAP